MMGHMICFYGEIWLIIPKLSLLPLLIWCTARPFCGMVLASMEANRKPQKLFPFVKMGDNHDNVFIHL